MMIATNHTATEAPLPIKIHMDESHARLILADLRNLRFNNSDFTFFYPHLSILTEYLEGVLK